jgi:uncharacterized membrane protein YbhN (UPF0104 family)
MGFVARGTYPRLLGCYFSGSFIGTVVPSTAGTDALRAMFATSALGGHLAIHMAPLVTLNLMSLSTGCALGLLSLALLAGQGFNAVFLASVALVFSGILAAAITGFLLLRYRRDLLIAILRRFRPRWYWLRRIARKFFVGLAVFARPGAPFWPVLAVTVTTQLLRALTLLLIAVALGLTIDPAVWVLMAPLTTVSGLLPLSVAGYGGEQAALVYLLAPFGVESARAVAISLTFATLWLVANVVYGGIAFLVSSRFLRVPKVAGAVY